METVLAFFLMMVLIVGSFCIIALILGFTRKTLKQWKKEKKDDEIHSNWRR